MTIKGLIFDFDGLLIDTEMPCFLAWVELFSQYGFRFTKQDYKKTIGTNHSTYDPANHLCQLTHNLLDPHVIFEQTKKRTRELITLQPLLPGVLEFLQSAQQRNLSMAVASSSSRSWVENYLLDLKIRDFFSSVSTSDDVQNVKPDPELFLLAAKKIGVLPTETIVFEDSLNGIKAAKAAGIYCVAIPNEITKGMDLSLADQVVDSFFDLELESLLNSNKSR